MSIGLDYEIVKDRHNDRFHVWTPCELGGVLGSGDTREQAIKNTIHNLTCLLAELSQLPEVKS